jgi:hypothetical protein
VLVEQPEILHRKQAVRVAHGVAAAPEARGPCEPNPGLAMLDMMVLLYFGEARQRTVAEYEELFGAARLELTRVLPTLSAFGIVEARWAVGRNSSSRLLHPAVRTSRQHQRTCRS